MKKSGFEQIVDKSLWSLEAKYGFKKVDTKFHQHGCTVRFQNTTTEVVLNYEIGEVPWFTLANIKNPETERISLDWLLVERNQIPSPSVESAFSPPELDESLVADSVQKQVNQMLEFGPELLKGDFGILPTLQKRADQYLVECKRFAEMHKDKA